MVIISNLKKKIAITSQSWWKKFSHKKGRKSFHSKQHGWHYAKWSKSDRERQTLCDFTFFFFFLHCEACGILVPLYWERRVLTIGLPDLTFMWNLKNKQKAELIQKPRTDWWMNEGGHKGHSSSYKIGKS